MCRLTARGLLIAVADLQIAIDLYTSVLGFTVTWRDRCHYAMLVNRDGLNIALASRDDHPCPGEVVLLAVSDDIYAALSAIVDTGGTVIAAPTVSGRETSALIKTPDGLYVSVYESISRQQGLP